MNKYGCCVTPKSSSSTLCLVMLFLTACSGSNSSVGAGAALSSLSSLPSAEELYQAFSTAINSSLTQANGESSGSDIVKDQSWACEGGGSVIIKATSTATSLQGTVELTDCSVAVSLGSEVFQETISGTASYSAKSNGTSSNANASSSLSISGELGLSAECSASLTNVETPAFNTPTSVKCTFRDSEDRELKSDVTENINYSDLLIPRAST